MVGPNTSEDVRTQQLVWNLQSKTPSTLRMIHGAHPMTRDEWHSIKAPTFIIAGEEVFLIKFLSDMKDKVCPPTEGEKIQAWLSAPNTPDMFIVPCAGHAIMIEAGEIVCDIINDFLIKLEPHLSHAWQLSYCAGETWSLKNEQKVNHL